MAMQSDKQELIADLNEHLDSMSPAICERIFSKLTAVDILTVTEAVLRMKRDIWAEASLRTREDMLSNDD